MGRGPMDNVLVFKLANLKSFGKDRPAHVGGQRCDSPDSEPCASIMAWWTAEFGNAEPGAPSVRAIPVEWTPPPDLPRHPIGDSAQGEILAGDEPTAVLLEGAIEIADLGGNSRIYRAGDMLVLPKGFNGTWRQLSPIRKVSVSYGWYAED